MDNLIEFIFFVLIPLALLFPSAYLRWRMSKSNLTFREYFLKSTPEENLRFGIIVLIVISVLCFGGYLIFTNL